ncbi:carbohydrate ABC transporter permease [Terracoccus luteus]|jgi:multiple sugar transport system permease protein|uniref:Carbohydrate ABC transporter membrane protein 2 (CUT1 family) n=1 Tax=Terracoccus luteus TaxID=53356 RepID=A0A495XW72_9MICO|nr:carbohydrate ABC transporter permease [Terracoccus luteus]MBB2986663.1 multiple sugar transport system permease protein [Terracoccus luteus]MCP2172314.1 multiple sugar transport system permease protein [Terracoccus luteus]RKT76713.1 carbohydrate ABC transporter membrane protein 2 (CUT1 family) [Terracoccus luteus]
MRTRPVVRVGQYLALAAYIVFLGFPLLWLVSASVKSSSELAALDMNVIPKSLNWGNYTEALQKQGLARSAVNSLIVSLLSMVLVVALSMPAAYALARFKGRLRTVGITWILVSQVFPVILIIIPLFLVLRQVALVDTLFGLVLVYTTFTMPFALWMLQGFVAAIPTDVEEAAAIDGATRFQTLRRIVFPLLMPGIVATAMFSFVAAWNEFFFALVLIQSPENYTLPVALKMFVGGEGKVALGPLAAGAVLATIPSLVIFSVLQRRLTGGLLTGSVKG